MEVISLKASSIRLFADALKDIRLSKNTDGALVIVSHTTRCSSDISANSVQAFILILLEAAQSATADYRMHFLAVAQLLEDRGGVPALLKCTILKTQMAMLVWYDISIALLNRRGCCIPFKYLEALAMCNDSHWTFYTMTGCYAELLLVAHKLCDLAAESGHARPSEFQTQLNEFESQIQQFGCDPLTDNISANVPDLDEAHDKMHGASLWKCTLLLYCARVFRQLPHSDFRVRSLARRVLEHARLIPLTSDGPSKQHLLPILLAAADEQSEQYRSLAVDYIQFWAGQLRFPLWHDALKLLRGVWTAQKENPTEDITLVGFCAGKDYMFG